MRILMDVDGVVADFTGHLLGCLSLRDKSVPSVEDIDTWDLKPHFTENQWKAVKQMLCDFCFWFSLPVIEGAQDGIERLKSEHEVVWVTSSYDSCPSWLHIRKQWLKKNFGAKSDEIVITSNKSLVAGDILVDDKPENIKRWQQHGVCYIFDAPYNRNIGGYRVADWPDLVSRLRL